MTPADDIKDLSKRGTKAPPVLPSGGWTAPLTTLAAGAMCFIAVLTLAAAMAASRVADEWRADLAGVATVRVSAPSDEMAGKLKAVLEVLRTTPGIAEIRVLNDAEQAALIAPWLGDDASVADLPSPRLIDLSLDEGGPDSVALQARLDLTVSGAVYDDHAAWRAPLAAWATALERLALGATVLVLITAGGMIAFATRATLIANRHVIETIRLIGAEDRFIANSFVTRLAARAGIGGACGAFLGCIAIILLPTIEADMALSVTISPNLTDWLLLAAGLPALTAIVAWLAAQAAVRVTLKRMP